MTKYTHRNGETEPPTLPGEFWFKGHVRGWIVEEKVVVVMWTGSGALKAIGLDAGSNLDDFDGEWYGPVVDTPPWEQPAPILDDPDGDDPLGLHRQRWVRVGWNTLIALQQMLDGDTDTRWRVFVEMLIIQAENELNTEQPAPQAEWERVPPQTEARAWNKARWIVCDDGEVVIQYPDMGVRAPLPDGWELRRRPA